jgi:hypothetical protein
VVATRRIGFTLAAAAALAIGGALISADNGSEELRVSSQQRLSLISRARVWTPTDVRSMDVTHGPKGHGFPPETLITCNFVEKKFDGEDPKFACALDGGDVVKVRYGVENGEVYAGVAATRLFWALGFGADLLDPVRVVCRGCPERLQPFGMATAGSIRFDFAAVERTFPGREVIGPQGEEGWSWPELDVIDPKAGPQAVAQRDALKLLAAVLLHEDSKPIQQRLLCEDGGSPRGGAAGCAHPFMMVHDLGHTFDHAREITPEKRGRALREWSASPVWADAQRCVANITPAHDGTLQNPVISEAGRRFLAGLLRQLTDEQVRALFSVARFDRGAHEGDSIAAWAQAFAQKRKAIEEARCR